MAGGIAEKLKHSALNGKDNHTGKTQKSHFLPYSNNSNYWQHFKFAAVL
jgi:hypothetical protein